MSEIIKFIEIAEKIKSKIYSNVYQSNEMLPSEKQLFKEYNVSRRTLRRALNTLVEDGFLYTVPGKGTFVSESAKNRYIVDLKVEKLLYKGFDSTRLIYATIVNPDIHEVYNLGISPDEKMISIKWVIERNGKPIACDRKCIPYLSGIPIRETDLSYSSLYDILSEKYLQNNLLQESYLKSVLPDEEICKILNLEQKSTPLIKFDVRLYDNNGITLGWETICALANEFKLEGISI